MASPKPALASTPDVTETRYDVDPDRPWRRVASITPHQLGNTFTHLYAVIGVGQTRSYLTKSPTTQIERTTPRRAPAQRVEEDMLTAPDVAREIGVSRRAEARESVLLAAARLARRERRLQRRIHRLDERMSGQSFTD